MRNGVKFILSASLLALTTPVSAQNAPDHPAVTVGGQTYTPRSILARNMGTTEDQTTALGPFHIIGNIYYVGTRTLSSYLLVTPQGNILIDSTYERNVPTIAKSVAKLGFKFSDIKILLGNHAHADHQEGDALVKQMTGAQVVAMEADIPALQFITPEGKQHPIDRIINDGDKVTLGTTTLTAHLTAGHTRGCTTWTTTATENGKAYNVLIGCSLRAPAVIPPGTRDAFERTFKYIRTLPCDVQLGDHGAQFGLLEKYARLKAGGPNPFIDPKSCFHEADVEEAMFKALLVEQQRS